jgi:hypothetical protein
MVGTKGSRQRRFFSSGGVGLASGRGWGVGESWGEINSGHFWYKINEQLYWCSKICREYYIEIE